MIKLGVTGTRSGMNETQKINIKSYLLNFVSKVVELHHGDCVGVDVEVAALAKDFGFKIVCHPPVKEELRGFFASDETREPFSYFARNRNIVNETDILLVVPFQSEPQGSGGTWYTYDYARKMQKQIKIFYP